MPIRRLALAGLLFAFTILPAQAHPGPHEHMSPIDALAHLASPFHLALILVAVSVGAAIVQRRARTIRARRKGQKS